MRYPPTSLSVERDRTPLEARNPSNTYLQSLQSIPASKPAAYRSPSLGYCSLGLEQSFFRGPRLPCHRLANFLLVSKIKPCMSKSMHV